MEHARVSFSGLETFAFLGNDMEEARALQVMHILQGLDQGA